MVRAEGFEPPRLSSREPKSRASTNSATPAKGSQRRSWRRNQPEALRGPRPAGKARPAGGAAYITRNSGHTIKIGSVYARSMGACSAAEHSEQPPVDRRQRLGQVLGDEAGAEFTRGLAMQPGGGTGGIEGRHALRHQPRDHAGEHVA